MLKESEAKGIITWDLNQEPRWKLKVAWPFILVKRIFKWNLPEMRLIFVIFTCTTSSKSVLREEFTKTKNLKSVFDGTYQNIMLGIGKGDP